MRDSAPEFRQGFGNISRYILAACPQAVVMRAGLALCSLSDHTFQIKPDCSVQGDLGDEIPPLEIFGCVWATRSAWLGFDSNMDLKMLESGRGAAVQVDVVGLL